MPFLRGFAVALGAVSLGSLVIQRTAALQRLGWSSVDQPRHVPVAVAMAGALAFLTVAVALDA